MSLVATSDAKLADLRQIALHLRGDERRELAALCLTPRHVLFSLWRESSVRRAVRVDGELAAVWGCAGLLASPVGEMWMLTTPVVERVPLAFAREAKRGLAEMLRHRDTLVSSVMEGCEQALRFMQIIGFRTADSYPSGPRGAIFRKIVMER